MPGFYHSAQYLDGNLNEWFHSVINFMGPNTGEGFNLFIDGMMRGVSARSTLNHGAINNGRIAVGRRLIENNNYLDYTSFAMDELFFFNRTLTDTEITMFSQTN